MFNQSDDLNHSETLQEISLQPEEIVVQETLDEFDAVPHKEKSKRKMSPGLRRLLQINGWLQQEVMSLYASQSDQSEEDREKSIKDAALYREKWQESKSEAEKMGYAFGTNPATGRFFLVSQPATEPEEQPRRKESQSIALVETYFDELLNEENESLVAIHQSINSAVSAGKYSEIAQITVRANMINERIERIEKYRKELLEALSAL